MKKQLVLTICLLILMFSKARSQTNYYRYNSSNGTSEKVGYSEPANNTPAFAPYRSTVDLGLYTRVGLEKQRRYDQNTQDVQNRINSIAKSIRLLQKLHEYIGGEENKRFGEFIIRLNNAGIDYGDNSSYQKVITVLQDYQEDVDNTIENVANRR